MAQKPRVRVTPKIVDEILERISRGESLRGITEAQPKRYPTAASFLYVVDNDESLLKRYARACSDRIDALAEETIAIADNINEDANSRRVRVDARKWFASKLRPDKYGDRNQIEHSGPGGGAMVVAHASLAALSDEELAAAVALQAKLKAIP